MTGLTPATARTLLFVPGNRPDRFDKALDAEADLVVFDLEDAVPVEDKDSAREQVVEAVRRTDRPVMVRINGADTRWHRADAAAVIDAGAHVMLPKAELPQMIEALGIPDGSPITVTALIETPLGVLEALAIARTPGVARLAFGSLDFAAALGIDPDHREALAAARAQLVLASAAAGIAGPIDGVTQAVRDPEALHSDVSYAKALGFSGKLCIHPAQIERSARVFAPTAEERVWANNVLDAVADSVSCGGGVAVVDGKMVDAPVLKRAQSIISAGRLDGVAES